MSPRTRGYTSSPSSPGFLTAPGFSAFASGHSFSLLAASPHQTSRGSIGQLSPPPPCPADRPLGHLLVLRLRPEHPLFHRPPVWRPPLSSAEISRTHPSQTPFLGGWSQALLGNRMEWLNCFLATLSLPLLTTSSSLC